MLAFSHNISGLDAAGTAEFALTYIPAGIAFVDRVLENVFDGTVFPATTALRGDTGIIERAGQGAEPGVLFQVPPGKSSG